MAFFYVFSYANSTIDNVQKFLDKIFEDEHEIENIKIEHNNLENFELINLLYNNTNKCITKNLKQILFYEDQESDFLLYCSNDYKKLTQICVDYKLIFLILENGFFEGSVIEEFIKENNFSYQIIKYD